MPRPSVLDATAGLLAEERVPAKELVHQNGGKHSIRQQEFVICVDIRRSRRVSSRMLHAPVEKLRERFVWIDIYMRY